MIEIRSLRDLLRLLFIYQREFKLAALSAVVIIVLGAFLLPAKYESNARLLVKPGRDSTLPIEISNRQALVMPSTQRDPIVDEERLLTGRPIVRQVAERYLEVLANRPPPEGLWKRTKFYVKKAIGAVFDGIRVTLETFGVIEETTAVERLAKDLEKKFEVTHAAGSTVMEISFTWSEPEVAQEVVKAWIEIYMEERTQALGRKSLYAFYEAQTADSAAQIKSYKAQILKHLNEIGASSIEDRLQDLSERINVLRGERFNSIRLIASSDSALESTRQQLKGLPREIVTVRQIALNPAQQDLRRLLNQKRLERADMMRTYTDDAPPVKALDASIRALEKEVQDEGATVQSSEDRAPNTLTTHLERVLLDETSNNAALRTQLAEQEKQLAELEAQRREALDIEPTLARLQRELNATERNYAQRVPTLAVDDEGRQQLAFVPRDSAGLEIVDDWSGFGQRTTGSGSALFDRVAVAAEDVVSFQDAFERPTTVGPLAQILHAAIDAGIARGAFEDTLRFVRERARPWVDSGVDKASDDPLTIHEIGRLAIRLHAAEALLERAGRVLDRATAEPDAESVAAASIAVAEARALTTEVALLAGSKLIELGGSRACLAELGLDRHWRNARVHTLHDPVRWKYHAVGDYYLNGRLPPRRGTL